MMNIDTKNYLLGKNQKDLVPIGQNHLLHRNVVEAFHLLRKLCRDNGFDLSVASSYRSFERQKTIWNEKALGKRQLLSDTGAPLNYETLSQEEILKSILRWSA